MTKLKRPSKEELPDGVDIGSITAKVVVFDLQNQMVFSDYRRHRLKFRRRFVLSWKR